ncbi:heme peroxidase 2-like [Uranotaenia lowii]|uniref:heme peroxidase 2-like n=1 Tax=Uranotaenia lowii TaxID=190385 RepID=UPI0024784ED2|nr:heme peroxidase 2-like [Uranotaenia lowii]
MRKVLAFCLTIPCVLAAFDNLRFPDIPKFYENYHQQCGIPIACDNERQCPTVADWRGLENYAQEEACSAFESQSELASKACYLISDREFDYGMFFTGRLNAEQENDVKNTMTTEILLKNISISDKCAVRRLLEGDCDERGSTLSLKQCLDNRVHNCDESYPYRSYDGHCNNKQNPTWGRAGTPFRLEMATCFDDFVSTPRRSSSGRELPNNRQVMADIQYTLNQRSPSESTQGIFNMFGVFFSEMVNSDTVGRRMKRVRDSTNGFRSCLADGSGISRFTSPLVDPMVVPADDREYGQRNVECLNFSPYENANDQCQLRFTTKRNGGSSFLDLSSIYGSGGYEEDGKLSVGTCGASGFTSGLSGLTIQLVHVTAIFAKLHNYCVDQTKSCTNAGADDVAEKCRAFTIGVYQKIWYEEVLLELFGPEFHNECNFECEYDPEVEPSLPSVYVNGPGRFQHVWIPDNLTYEHGDSTTLPMHLFFRNHQNFDCPSILEGMLKDPIRISGLSDSIMHTFSSLDGKDGHCLMCLDLERGRNAGMCPYLPYKHYQDTLTGRANTNCYQNFEDLSDIFEQDLIEVFKKHYETPSDLDLLFSIFEKDRPRGSSLPTTVALSTCLTFKRLKCGDRFFYKWNPFYTSAMSRLISIMDMTTVLALVENMNEVPVRPFVTQSSTVRASQLRDKVGRIQNLFCQL